MVEGLCIEAVESMPYTFLQRNACLLDEMRQRFGCSAKGILFVWPYPFWSYYVCFLLQMQLASFIETGVFETIEHVGNYVFKSA